MAPVIVVQANSPDTAALDFDDSHVMAGPPAAAAMPNGMLTVMDSAEFRHRGKEMVDYIVDYMDTIDQRRVTPAIEPGEYPPIFISFY